MFVYEHVAAFTIERAPILAPIGLVRDVFAAFTRTFNDAIPVNTARVSVPERDLVYTPEVRILDHGRLHRVTSIASAPSSASSMVLEMNSERHTSMFYPAGRRPPEPTFLADASATVRIAAQDYSSMMDEARSRIASYLTRRAVENVTESAQPAAIERARKRADSWVGEWERSLGNRGAVRDTSWVILRKHDEENDTDTEVEVQGKEIVPVLDIDPTLAIEDDAEIDRLARIITGGTPRALLDAFGHLILIAPGLESAFRDAIARQEMPLLPPTILDMDPRTAFRLFKRLEGEPLSPVVLQQMHVYLSIMNAPHYFRALSLRFDDGERSTIRAFPMRRGSIYGIGIVR